MSLAWFKYVDEEISKNVFESSLPWVLEAILSMPGNWFGIAPVLLVGPLWVGAMVGNGQSLALTAVTFALTLAFAVLWFSFLRWETPTMKKIICSKESFGLFPPLGILLCYLLIPDNEQFSMAIYPICVWIPSITTALCIKGQVLRHRPCAKYTHLIGRKHYQLIPKYLAKHAADGSFPSCDAAGVVAFALPMAAQRPDWASLLVSLACVGRLYFLAHHVGDTIIGCSLTLVIHVALTQSGFGMKDLQWWHPLLQQLIFGVFATTIGKNITKGR
jgi:hypothetical protein